MIHFLIMTDKKYSIPFTVPSSWIDGHCRFTTFGMISAAQDVTAVHYGSGGLSIPHLQKKGLTWVLVKQRFEINEYPLWMDSLYLQTWAKPPKGPFFFRDYAYTYAKNGRKTTMDRALLDVSSGERTERDEHALPFLRATSNWMVLNTESLKPLKPTDNVMGSLELCSDDSLESSFPKINLPDGTSSVWDIEHKFSPTITDIDINSHVNNLSYIRWILSYIPQKVYEGRLISSLETYYLSSAVFSQKLICRVCEIEQNTCVHSIIREQDGSEVFRAKTVWKNEDSLCRKIVIE